jgi:hypothetical protein
MDFSHLKMEKMGPFTRDDLNDTVVLNEMMPKERFFEIYNMIKAERAKRFSYGWDLDIR